VFLIPWLLQRCLAAVVRVLPDGNARPPPHDVASGYWTVHPALTRPWDLQYLTKLVLQRCHACLPDALPPAALEAVANDTVALSYLLSANLPVHPSVRQVGMWVQVGGEWVGACWMRVCILCRAQGTEQGSTL
jgi:hypothetical protein